MLGVKDIAKIAILIAVVAAQVIAAIVLLAVSGAMDKLGVDVSDSAKKFVDWFGNNLMFVGLLLAASAIFSGLAAFGAIKKIMAGLPAASVGEVAIAVGDSPKEEFGGYY